MTKVIGLTGGIGSGKSTVSQYLLQNNIPVIDTDIIARQIVEPNSTGLNQVIDLFGATFLNSDGSLNRPLLRNKIFNDPQAKSALESLLHPLIQAETLKQIQYFKKQQQPYIFIAIPLLVEGILKKGTRPGYIDEIWVVDCPVEKQLQQASQRDNSDVNQIQKIINQQASRQQRLVHADKVISNTSSIQELLEQTQSLIQKI
ncbi:dephospho-CoA kinase [Thiomicrorhabdus sp. Milos-T2]|uniref:dephospho-CoA kinase n=1 Tax=Thiomicrorhabdus sp. Milos-T2 TaxID=90814 RepID=UPI000493D132|nr:dephospho-CoA kinase [Thiomicrorhabdus sp. Milos-T2]